MKHVYLIIILFLCLLISACTSDPVIEETVPSTEVLLETNNTEPETIAETIQDEIILPEEDFSDYVYIYENERDRAWEEDVIYLAQIVLGQHPVVQEDYHWIYTSKDWWQVYTAQNPFYDVTVRNTFIGEIRSLIAALPERTDREINYEMRRIVGLLNDAHSDVQIASGDMFPLGLKVLYEGDEAGIYVVKAPAEYSYLLYSRLVSVNEVPVKEIVHSMMAYVTSENDYLSSNGVIDYSWKSVMMWTDSLRAVGVLGKDENSAFFNFLNEAEETVTLTLDAVSYDTYKDMDSASGIFSAEEYLDCEDVVQPNYWCARLTDRNVYYVRISQFRNSEDAPFATFFNDIMLELYAVEEPQQVIIDLRGNGGGNVLWQMVNDFFGRLDGANINGVYILMDERSCSASVIMACQVKNAVGDVVIVGSPAGQPPNFFTGQTYEKLPNSGIDFSISTYYVETWKNYPYDALMPDITIYQTLDDYKNGVDTVLEAVLAMGE